MTIRSGLRLADEVDDEPSLGRVGRADLGVAKPSYVYSGAADLRGAPGLAVADRRDLVGGMAVAAAIAARRVAHHHVVTLPDEARERPAAEDLQVVGVCADGEDPHGRPTGTGSTKPAPCAARRRRGPRGRQRRVAEEPLLDLLEREPHAAECHRLVAEPRENDARRHRHEQADASLERPEQARARTRDAAAEDHRGRVENDDRRRDAPREPVEHLLEHLGCRRIALRRGGEDRLGVDRLRVAAGELEQRARGGGHGRRSPAGNAGERGRARCALERAETVARLVSVGSGRYPISPAAPLAPR